MAIAMGIAPPATLAQVASGSVRGRVVDPMQAPIAAAEVTVTGEHGPATLRTNADGRFEVDLPPGTYAFTAVAPGFAPVTTTVAVSRDQLAAPMFVLPVAGLQENVTVNATSGYRVPLVSSSTRTPTALRDIPQAITVVTDAQIKDQLMTSVADVMRYVPGVTTHQGENNRDQVIIRGNSSSADFFVNGVRDDVQYDRDLYNLDRVEALKGPNALTFGRGGAGGVINRIVKEAHQQAGREVLLQGGQYGNKRATIDLNQPLSSHVAVRLNGMIENSDSFRQDVGTERAAFNPTVTFQPSETTRVTGSYEYLQDRRVADRGITSVRGVPAAVPIETFFGDPAQSEVHLNVHLATAGVEHRVGRAMFRNRLQVADYGRFYQNFVPGAANAHASLVPLTVYNNETNRTNVFNQTDVTVAAETGGIHHTLLGGAEFAGSGPTTSATPGFSTTLARHCRWRSVRRRPPSR